MLAIGPSAPRRLARLTEAGLRAREADAGELPCWRRTTATRSSTKTAASSARRDAIAALTDALRDSIVADEVLSVRRTGEVRAGGSIAHHDRIVVCAGRGTPALARGAGLALPVQQSAHVRLTFRVRGEPPARLPCLLDSEAGAYGDPLPGNAAYAIGIGETPVHEDGGVLEPAELTTETERIIAYVRERLPGLDPAPVDVRHCWVTELPWSHDGLAVWERDALLVLAGNNLFKHAPALGRLIAARRARRGAGPAAAHGRAARLRRVVDVGIVVAADHGGDVVAHVAALLDPVEDHHLHHRDHPRGERAELLDDLALVARRPRVHDEREQLVRQRLLVNREPEDRRHSCSGYSGSVPATWESR